MSLYVSLQEFKSAPTAIDLSGLDQTAIGTQAAQDAALLNILKTASGWVDRILGVDSLTANTYTELREIHTARDGRMTIHVKNVPLVSLTSCTYRYTPQDNFATIPTNYIEVYPKWFTVYGVGTNFLNMGNTMFPMFYSSPYMLQQLSNLAIAMQYTYVAGYFNSTLTANATAGATTITVQSTLGLAANSKFTIYDGANTEDCYVSSINGNVITLTAPTLFAHNSGVSASAIPNPVKQATILLAGYLIKERGSAAITMNESVVSGTTIGYNKPSDVQLAKQLLEPFRRVVLT